MVIGMNFMQQRKFPRSNAIKVVKKCIASSLKNTYEQTIVLYRITKE